MQLRINKRTLYALAEKLHPEDVLPSEDTVFMRRSSGAYSLIGYLRDGYNHELCVLPVGAEVEYLDQTWWVDENGKSHFKGSWTPISDDELRELGFLR